MDDVVQVNLRLPAETLERVDAARGPLARNTWLLSAVIAALPDEDPPAPVNYEELRPGDVIEVQINSPLFPQEHGNWERREVVAVDRGDPEDAHRVHVVRFTDGEREYDIEPAADPGRRMRRCSS